MSDKQEWSVRVSGCGFSFMNKGLGFSGQKTRSMALMGCYRTYERISGDTFPQSMVLDYPLGVHRFTTQKSLIPLMQDQRAKGF